ncbi:MAG: HNH endonuclease [Actinomycetales bacterium]|nr:HNH endonuclease [Actinomycetales bacterium]
MFDSGSGDAVHDPARDAEDDPARDAVHELASDGLPAERVPLNSAVGRVPMAHVSTNACLPDLLSLEPGVEVLACLASQEIAGLNADDAIAYVQIMDRVLSWCQALQDDALAVAVGPVPQVERFAVGSDEAVGSDHSAKAQVDGPVEGPAPGRIDIEDLACEEVSAALRWSAGFTSARVAGARLLAGPLAATQDELRRGRISPAHARAVVTASQRVPGCFDPRPEAQAGFARACRQLQDAVLPVAALGTVAQTRRAADRVVARLVEQGPASPTRTGLGVQLFDEGGGISTLIARMRTVHAHACFDAIDRVAQHQDLEVPADALIGERRALALAAMVLPMGGFPASVPASGAFRSTPGDLETASCGPLRPFVQAHVEVTVSLETLLGLSQEPGELRSGRGCPAPIGASAVRELVTQCDDLTLRRLLTDPVTGHLLDRGRRAYRVSDSLRAFIVARDRHCRFPGCLRQARNCEIDHATAWGAAGSSDRANLGALCKRHHLAKTLGGWRILSSALDGSCTWQSPGGRMYRHRAVAQPGSDPGGHHPVIRVARDWSHWPVSPP